MAAKVYQSRKMPTSSSLPKINQMYVSEYPGNVADSSPSETVTCFPFPAYGARTQAAGATRTMTGSSIPRRVSQTGVNSSMTPAEAIAKFRRILTAYELNEIKNFANIWFVGPTARKISGAKGKGPNDGYDDDKGRYRCVKNDHLAYRYEIVKGLGKGSFGDVVKAYDHKSKSHLAVKIIRNEKRFHQQAKSEVKILDLLRRQDRRNSHNVIHMKDSFSFRGHLCVAFEMLHSDLYAALKKNNFRGFRLSTVQQFAQSIVTALRVLRRSRIIHCDLKPENLLLKSADSTDVKVIDFGSSCFSHEKIHTYIQSRFYRSPEVILGLSYGIPIDMWSLGCILAELHTGRPLFPGHDESEQLLLQMEILGIPPLSLIRRAQRASHHFDEHGKPRNIRDKRGRLRRARSKSLSSVLMCNDEHFLDFIKRCLTWDPAERMTPKDAASHPFLTGGEEKVPTTTSLHSMSSSESTLNPTQNQVAERTQSDSACNGVNQNGSQRLRRLKSDATNINVQKYQSDRKYG
eukprot:m.209514 g.209514  ORF g.209514 m.209514 type:complete len:518 (+) comp15816_c0_seq28:4298-5851(+)